MATGAFSSANEPRWPWLTAGIGYLGLNALLRIWLPSDIAISPVHWLLPAAEILLIAALILDNPVNGVRFPAVRTIQVTISCGLALAALFATVMLVKDLVSAADISQHAGELLAVGGTVWLGNIYAFSILIWLTDSGGPVARAEQSKPRDFAFELQQNPELVDATEWHPYYLDYLHLAFTNATSFSPGDGLPLSHRAKFVLLLQSTVSLALVALVIARSVNAFT